MHIWIELMTCMILSFGLGDALFLQEILCSRMSNKMEPPRSLFYVPWKPLLSLPSAGTSACEPALQHDVRRPACVQLAALTGHCGP